MHDIHATYRGNYDEQGLPTGNFAQSTCTEMPSQTTNKAIYLSEQRSNPASMLSLWVPAKDHGSNGAAIASDVAE